MTRSACSITPRNRRPRTIVHWWNGEMEIRRGQLPPRWATSTRPLNWISTEPEIHYQRSLILTQLGRLDEANRERSETARLEKEKRNWPGCSRT